MDDLQSLCKRLGIREGLKEHRRQLLERQRELEDEILRMAELPHASDHTKEVAQDIRDHRACHHYTTLGNLPE